LDQRRLPGRARAAGPGAIAERGGRADHGQSEHRRDRQDPATPAQPGTLLLVVRLATHAVMARIEGIDLRSRTATLIVSFFGRAVVAAVLARNPIRIGFLAPRCVVAGLVPLVPPILRGGAVTAFVRLGRRIPFARRLPCAPVGLHFELAGIAGVLPGGLRLVGPFPTVSA